MQHFFFNIRDDSVLIRDNEGQPFKDLDQAIALAKRMAWHANVEVAPEAKVDQRRIEICNEVGLTVQIVSVRKVAEEGSTP